MIQEKDKVLSLNELKKQNKHKTHTTRGDQFIENSLNRGSSSKHRDPAVDPQQPPPPSCVAREEFGSLPVQQYTASSAASLKPSPTPTPTPTTPAAVKAYAPVSSFNAAVHKAYAPVSAAKFAPVSQAEYGPTSPAKFAPTTRSHITASSSTMKPNLRPKPSAVTTASSPKYSTLNSPQSR